MAPFVDASVRTALAQGAPPSGATISSNNLAATKFAAEAGNATAQFELGLLYQEGNGVPRSMEKAKSWWAKAAAQGYEPAAKMLSRLSGKTAQSAGVPSTARSSTPPAATPNLKILSDKDLALRGQLAADQNNYSLAFTYYRELAERGNAPAQCILGVFYRDGDGVAPDIEQARYWLSKSAAQGYERAKDMLAELTDKASPSNGTTASQSAQSADAPSDDDIVQIVRNRLLDETIGEIRERYGDLDKLKSGDVLDYIQGFTPYTAQAVLGCTMNAPAQKDRCMMKLRDELRAQRAQELAKVSSSSIENDYVLAVRRKTNYEGNYVANVDVRPRGTDHTFKWKLLLKYQSGRWVIAEKSEQEVH